MTSGPFISRPIEVTRDKCDLAEPFKPATWIRYADLFGTGVGLFAFIKIIIDIQ